jgi:polysaccharide pyruvyl transferase WcaK-like protein
VCLYSRSSDKKIVDAIRAGIGDANVRVVSQKECRSHVGMLPILAGAVFTIGGRYHTAISSLSMRTPVILTAGNTYKNEGLGELLGITLPVFQHGDQGGIVAQAKAYLETREKDAAALERGLAHIIATQETFSNTLAERIRHLLEGHTSNALAVDQGGGNDGPIQFPRVVVRQSENRRPSNIRTRLDLSANLRRYPWEAVAKG